MTPPRVSFACSDPGLNEAAEAAVLAGGSALTVASNAYLAACARSPGVLLSPVSILFSGFGARRAFDGRCRQPGFGLPRPRGFRPEEAIPDAARVAVPRALQALLVSANYDESVGHGRALRQAASTASKLGAKQRAQLLSRAAEVGALVYRGTEVARELMRVGGVGNGGLVSRDDLEAVSDVDERAAESEADGGGTSLTIPWHEESAVGSAVERHAIIAIDRRGSAAAICYEDATSGIPILDGELVCPLLARPVQRSVPRIAPGTPLSQVCPARIQLDGESGVLAVISSNARIKAPH